MSNSTVPESNVTQKALSKKLDDFQVECNLNGAEHREKAHILATSKPHAGAWINALPLPSINTTDFIKSQPKDGLESHSLLPNPNAWCATKPITPMWITQLYAVVRGTGSQDTMVLEKWWPSLPTMLP